MAHQLHEYKGHDNITYNTYDNCNNYIGIRTVTQNNFFYLMLSVLTELLILITLSLLGVLFRWIAL